MLELASLREEQDQLAARTAEILAKVRTRREQFRQLWGVSPLRINTRRTQLRNTWQQEDEVKQEQEEQQERGQGAMEESDSEQLDLTCEETGIVPLAFTPAPRKVRFNSGLNNTRAVTPQDTAAPSLPSTPSDITPPANASNQSFAALKTSFGFLATPLAAAGGSTPHLARNTPGGRAGDPTPLALRSCTSATALSIRLYFLSVCTFYPSALSIRLHFLSVCTFCPPALSVRLHSLSACTFCWLALSVSRTNV